MKPILEKPLDKSHITKIALEILQARKIYAWRQNNVRAVKGRSFVGLKGVPDIIGWHLHTSCFVGCECKTTNDPLSEDQIRLLSALHQAGGIALIACQVGNGVEIVPFIEYLKIKKK